MRKKEMEKFKKVLLTYKQSLLKDVQKGVDSSKEEPKEEVRDSADIASDYYEREWAINLSEADRKKLELVEDALERIEEGKYGICDACGCIIAVPRLEALPFTKLCIACKAQEEKKKN
jgi:DnaK suppressor protein